MEIIKPIDQKHIDIADTQSTFTYERDPNLTEFYEKIEKDLKDGLTFEDIAILKFKPIAMKCN